MKCKAWLLFCIGLLSEGTAALFRGIMLSETSICCRVTKLRITGLEIKIGLRKQADPSYSMVRIGLMLLLLLLHQLGESLPWETLEISHPGKSGPERSLLISTSAK